MKRVLTAVVLVPAVLAAVFLAPDWLFLLLLWLIALGAAHEYLALVRTLNVPISRLFTYLAVTAVFVGLWLVTRAYGGIDEAYPLALVAGGTLFAGLFPMFALPIAMRVPELSSGPGAAALGVLAPLYVGLPLAAIGGLRFAPYGRFWVIYLLLVVWAGDIAAYYVGSSIGKHKLAPRISPGKSWEGTYASIAGSVFVAWLLARFLLPQMGAWAAPMVPYAQPMPSLGVLFPTLAAIAVNVAAQFGDLSESLLKRAAGVKDSGALLPGHGGVLDRIDALLFAAPLLWYIEAFATLLH
jgi:phosphatidate cytidylyltransferase